MTEGQWDNEKFLRECIDRQTEMINELQDQISTAVDIRREWEKELLDLLEKGKADGTGS